MSRLLYVSPSLPKLSVWLCGLLLVAGVASAHAQEAGSTTMVAVVPADAEHGTACWHQGHDRMADGGRWSAKDFTAAHRSLPLGTRVRVVNLKNGRATVVRITDRGPYTNGFIIDLSPAAAREVGLLESGIGKVRVEILKAEPGETSASKPPA